MAKKQSYDWAKIKVEFIKSTLSIRDFAETFGIPLGTLSRKVTKEKWSNERSQIDNEVITRSIDKTVENKSDELSRFESKTLKAIDYAQDEIIKMLGMSEKPAEIKALSSALVDLQKAYRLALGASTENQATSNVSEFSDWLTEIESGKFKRNGKTA